MMRRDATQLRVEPFRNDSCTLASNELPHERVKVRTRSAHLRNHLLNLRERIAAQRAVKLRSADGCIVAVSGHPL